jgi:hypothetical protein
MMLCSSVLTQVYSQEVTLMGRIAKEKRLIRLNKRSIISNELPVDSLMEGLLRKVSQATKEE